MKKAKNKQIQKKLIAGYSLLEMVVVLSVFALLAMVSSQALILTLRGSNKASSVASVRENVDFAVASIERQLRNASEVTPCREGTDVDNTTVSYLDQYGQAASYSCQSLEDKGYIASGSGRLTNEEVVVSDCSFECEPAKSGLPPYVEINISARNANAEEGITASSVTTSTRIYLRTY